MTTSKIHLFYDERMTNTATNIDFSTSKSPWKPALVVKKLLKGQYRESIQIEPLSPLEKEDFYLAHTREYVHNFLNGVKPSAISNHLPWSPELVESVKYCHGAFYHGLEFALHHPEAFCVVPVSGFHHAQPENGSGFCTFSGQVISSVKLYQKYGARGAYFDLDGHYGNSIGDTQEFQSLTNTAIVMNANIRGQHQTYLDDLKKWLERFERNLKNNIVQYAVWCHGADSHEHDDLVGSDRVNTKEWLQCSKLFYNAVAAWRGQGYKVPVVTTLFGGYREDDFNFVIGLHAKDIELGHEILNLNPHE